LYNNEAALHNSFRLRILTEVGLEPHILLIGMI